MFLMVIGILTVIGCVSSGDVLEIPSKEIIERKFSKYGLGQPFVFKYDAVYSYENGLYKKRNLLSDQDKTSTEKLFYDENGNLIRIEIHGQHMMLFEEKIAYDDQGRWILKETFNTKGDNVAQLKVSERTKRQTKGAGFIRKSKVRMLSENGGKDSIMLRQVVVDEQAYYQKWIYKKNNEGELVSIKGYQVDLVSPESFEVLNDSLIASFDYSYQFPPNCSDWSLMITNGYYEAKSGEMVSRRDSVLRITVSLEKAVLDSDLLTGFWQVREMPATSYQFFNDGQYKAYSGNQLAEKGKWNILESKKKIMFQSIGLKNQKSMKFWNIKEVFKDKITIIIHDKEQSIVRLNKDFTFYRFDNQ